MLDNLKSMLSGLLPNKSKYLDALLINLEDTLQFNISWFQLIYEKELNDLYFLVKYPDNIIRKCDYSDGKKIIEFIEPFMKDKMPAGSSMDVVAVEYNEGEGYKFIAAYRTPEGEKMKLSEPIK